MGTKTICMLPEITSLGGPRSFQKKFQDQAAKSGIEVHFNPGRKDIGAFLIIGAPRRFLPHLLWARLRNVPVIQRLNGMNWIHQVVDSGLKYYLHSEIDNLSIAFVRRWIASGIIYQSPFCEERWNKKFGVLKKPEQIIYNGVNLDDFKPSVTPPDSQSIQIMMVEGNLDHGSEYGIEIAIRMVLGLSEKFSVPIVLQIAGNVNPQSRERIQKVFGTLPPHVQVNFLGVLPKQEIAALESRSTFFYSAEILTACPNAVIEALACGLPVLGFDTGSLKDVVGDGGLVISYGADYLKLEEPDINALIHAAETIVHENPDYRARARKRAENAFPLDQMTLDYIRFCLRD